MLVSALDIKTGADLELFKPRLFSFGARDYHVLTGYETELDTCWWCGKLIEKGKRQAHYCRGRSHDDFLSCFRLYHDHFDWSYASSWALRRAKRRCENCGLFLSGWHDGEVRPDIPTVDAIEIHHIVPLRGAIRLFSVYNLPWNLVVLCHACHVGPDGIHAAMRPPKPVRELTPQDDSWRNAEKIGQANMLKAVLL